MAMGDIRSLLHVKKSSNGQSKPAYLVGNYPARSGVANIWEQIMKENMIRIEYRDFQVNTDQSGWYLFEYKSIADMSEDIPCDVVGPFMTRAAASRAALEASDIKDRREREHKNERTPSAPVTSLPAPLDAGIPTDNDGDDEEPANDGEGVHVELQQTQELRDVSPEVQSD